MGCVNSNPKPNTKPLPIGQNATSIPVTGANGGLIKSDLKQANKNDGIQNINSNASSNVYLNSNVNGQANAGSYGNVNTYSNINTNSNQPINSYTSKIATNANVQPSSSTLHVENKNVESAYNSAYGVADKKLENTQLQVKNGYSNISENKGFSQIKKDINNSAVKADNFAGSSWAAGASGISSPAKNSVYQGAYESKRINSLDDQGFVPEDSVMDFGQTTIEDLNKVQVNFHV